MSTRESIWLGEDRGKSVHIYWELAERELENGKIIGVPMYIEAEAADSGEHLAIRLPKAIALRLLMVLSPNFADEARRVI